MTHDAARLGESRSLRQRVRWQAAQSPGQVARADHREPGSEEYFPNWVGDDPVGGEKGA